LDASNFRVISKIIGRKGHNVKIADRGHARRMNGINTYEGERRVLWVLGREQFVWQDSS
jgi:hypothetical protein